MARALTVVQRIRTDSGQGLMELVIALTILAVAVSALLALLTSSIVSLTRANTRGTAVMLTERQMELYRAVPYSDIQLSAATIPSGSDPYVTANASDSTIPASTGQLTGGTTSASTCLAAHDDPLAECAVQQMTGADSKQYRVDSYIVAVTPSGGRANKQVTVVVREIKNGTVGGILARATSAYDAAYPPSN